MNLTEDAENTDADLAHLRDALTANPNDSALQFQLGLHLWDKGAQFQEKAAQHFLIAAKLDPLNGPPFKFLGHFYSNAHHANLDFQRAIKCFQRAVSLNPDDFDSGEALCDLLDKAGKEILEVAVCKEASEKSPRAFWAFRRLGYLQVYQNKWSEAVQSLQHAIRGYPACADLWEALGLAYQRLGMFTAAIKSYGRAIELDDKRAFALIESGNIYLMLGSFRKGVDKFRETLEILPDNVSALYGLASGLLGLSLDCINLGSFRWGASILEEASKVAKSGACLAGNISSLWKLLGDVQLAYAKFLPWIEEGQSLSFDLEAFRTSIYSWKKTRLVAATSAKNSYQRALHLAPWQANIYADIAVTSDYISILTGSTGQGLNTWQVSEKMALGAVSLECNNHDFWVVLGCVSDHRALKQHAVIRGLQLDVSLAMGWAYLGKTYREESEKQLARQAFDCARSIDPSLAMPWAGMSADSDIWDSSPDEAFESCLRAVQTLPHAEFQLGLVKFALQSGHLSFPQVLGAIQQAVQQAPHYPESHNLKGLACEALFDYLSAAVSYKLARHAISSDPGSFPKSQYRDISINLARSLILAGNASDAIYECENLKKEGILDAEVLQIYAFSLWKVGQNDQALSIARNLAANIFAMDQKLIAASVSFICRLLYNLSGLDSAINSILRMPKEFFQNSKISLIVSAIHALDESNRLEPVVSSSQYFLVSHEDMIKMHILTVLGKLVKHRSKHCLGFQSAVIHLRKSLHKYPNSSLIRNLLGYLLLCRQEWNDVHAATRCYIIGFPDSQSEGGLKSACDVLGAGSVACYAVGNSNPRFSFPTCGYLCLKGSVAIQKLQKSLHQEPWKGKTRFLLILNLFQKAREERYPQHLSDALQRLIPVALSDESYSEKDMSCRYQKFQFLLCASEISLQSGNQSASIGYARNALTLALPDGCLFFAHLLLCRAYAAGQSFQNAQAEYERCLKLKTDYLIGWLCLKLLECQYELQTDVDILKLCSESSSKIKNSWDMWMAVVSLVQGLVFFGKQDYVSAEQSFSQACSWAGAESCLSLCHGATCMELARLSCDSHFLSLAVRNLTKAQETSVVLLPIVSALLAQAHGSLGSKKGWENNLRYEWCSWPPEMRPAELFFQMHLLARESNSGADGVEFCQSQQKWVLRAIHVNPSCSRYWKVLQKFMQ